MVYTINKIEYYTIAIGKNEKKPTPSLILNYPIEKSHYYCETLDLTRPYPSHHTVTDFDPNFCWNIQWRESFNRAPNSCIILLQGFCSAKKKNFASLIPKRPQTPQPRHSQSTTFIFPQTRNAEEKDKHEKEQKTEEQKPIPHKPTITASPSFQLTSPMFQQALKAHIESKTPSNKAMTPISNDHKPKSILKIKVDGDQKDEKNGTAEVSNILYILRRSVKNSGTRYNARGIDSESNPGNEVECDLVFFKNNEYYANTWRRGTVPIFWETTQTLLFIPQHRVVAPSFKETMKYFVQLSNCFNSIPITVVSLLDKNETELESTYKEEVRKIECPKISFFTYDINRKMSDYKDKELVFDCQHFLHELSLDSGFKTKTERQKTLLRFNCLDSLDRTNIATFAHARNLAMQMNCSEDDLSLIASMFIEGGDSISLIYTGTSCVKSDVISCFVKQSKNRSIDTPTNIRRYINTAIGDGQQILLNWISPPRLVQINNKFILDPLHLSIVPTFDQFVSAGPKIADEIENAIGEVNTHIGKKVFETKDVQYNHFPSSLITSISKNIQIIIFEKESEQQSLVIKLPEPLEVVSLNFLAVPPMGNIKPPESFSVFFGNNISEMMCWMENIPFPIVNSAVNVSYPLDESNLWCAPIPKENGAEMKTEFIRLDFKCGKNVFIGNINIECTLSKEFTITHSMDTFETNPCRIVMSNYQKQLNDISRSEKIDFGTSFKLEIKRLCNKVPIKTRNMALVQIGKNPCMFEPLFFLNSNQKNCALCKKESRDVHQVIPESLSFPSLLEPDANSKGGVTYIFCSSCLRQFAELRNPMKSLLNKYEEQRPPRIKCCRCSDAAMTSAVSTDPILITASIVTRLDGNFDFNEIIADGCESSDGDGEVQAWESLDEREEFAFIMVLDFFAELSSVHFEFVPEYVPSSISIENIEFELDTSDFVFRFPPETCCESLRTLVRFPRPSKLKLEKIEIFGRLKRPFIPITAFFEYHLSFSASKRVEEYIERERTSVFRIDPMGVVRLIVFELKPETAEKKYPKSIIVGIYYRNVLIMSYDIILPKVKSECSFGYRIPHHSICDTVKVFYLDRVVCSERHVLMFNVGPPDKA